MFIDLSCLNTVYQNNNSLGTGINVLLTEGGELPPGTKEEVPSQALAKDELGPLMPLQSSRLPLAHNKSEQQLATEGASPVHLPSTLSVSIPAPRRLRSRNYSTSGPGQHQQLFSPGALTPAPVGCSFGPGFSQQGVASAQSVISGSGFITPPIGARRALASELPQYSMSPPPASALSTNASAIQQQSLYAPAGPPAPVVGVSSLHSSLQLPLLLPFGNTLLQKMREDLHCLVRQHILTVKIFTRDMVRLICI